MHSPNHWYLSQKYILWIHSTRSQIQRWFYTKKKTVLNIKIYKIYKNKSDTDLVWQVQFTCTIVFSEDGKILKLGRSPVLKQGVHTLPHGCARLCFDLMSSINSGITSPPNRFLYSCMLYSLPVANKKNIKSHSFFFQHSFRLGHSKSIIIFIYYLYL